MKILALTHFRKYDSHQKKLFKLVRKKGILVEKMKKGTPYVSVVRRQYKKDLGSIPIKSLRGDITNVYLVYEDYDGSIKYYDYPQFSKNIKEMKKRKIGKKGD